MARMTARQRKEPVAAAGRAPGQRHKADFQPGGQCHHGCQHCVGQLTDVVILRNRGPRATGPSCPGGLESTQCRPFLLRTESRNGVARMAAQTQLKESTPPGVNPIASVVAFHLTRSTSSVETGAAELFQDCRMNVATAAISSWFSNCPYGGMPKG